jgi:hypothetical protein
MTPPKTSTIDEILKQYYYLMSVNQTGNRGQQEAISEAKAALNQLLYDARLETMQKVSDRLDDLHQGTEGAGWVHYGEMGEWLDEQLTELKALKVNQTTNSVDNASTDVNLKGESTQ